MSNSPRNTETKSIVRKLNLKSIWSRWLTGEWQAARYLPSGRDLSMFCILHTEAALVPKKWFPKLPFAAESQLQGSDQSRDFKHKDIVDNGIPRSLQCQLQILTLRGLEYECVVDGCKMEARFVLVVLFNYTKMLSRLFLDHRPEPNRWRIYLSSWEDSIPLHDFAEYLNLAAHWEGFPEWFRMIGSWSELRGKHAPLSNDTPTVLFTPQPSSYNTTFRQQEYH